MFDLFGGVDVLCAEEEAVDPKIPGLLLGKGAIVTGRSHRAGDMHL